MMVRYPFLFVAGALPLDFLNTEVMLDGSPADLVQDGDDLLRWIEESGLATKARVRSMNGGASLKTSLHLRAGMRALFTRLAAGQPMRDADLRAINDVLAAAPGALHVQRSDARASIAFEPRAETPAWLIARASAEFLASADLTLVRRCQGEGCILFFHDTTKSHTRRWCSMATCGNRTKVKAHYVRKRSGE